MTLCPKEEKEKLRKLVLQARRQFPYADRLKASEAIASRLLQQTAYQQAVNVFAYASMPDEVQTMNLLEKMLADGKKVFLPRITGKRSMRMVRLRHIEDLFAGDYGILTVRNDCQEYLEPEQLDVMLVPGVAFDNQGRRLGMGGGYYDTLMPLTEKAVRLALAYEIQMVANVPMEKHDCKVDFILTEQRCVACGKK